MIKNLKKLSAISDPETKHRREILFDIVNYTLENLLPEKLLNKELVNKDLSAFNKIAIFAIGKAAQKMADAVNNLLPRKATFIAIADKGHPLPTQFGVQNSNRIIAQAKTLTTFDLAIVLLSGGGSTMFVKPAAGITLEEKIEITNKLLRSGASINEINVIRKHLSQVKGGRFAEILYPAKVWALVISDVIGNDLSTIASGPLSPDPTIFSDALNLLEKYHINAPNSIIDYFKKGKADSGLETPKMGEKYFQNIEIKIVADHNLSAQLALQRARELKLSAQIYSTKLSGESRKQALAFTAKKQNNSILIATGETTVTVRGKGSGGRNQEFVLSALNQLNKIQSLISVGTDGIDGICPEEVAGAIGDIGITTEAKEKKLNIEKFLQNNDSYTFFKKTNGLIKTGKTGTNVGDLVLLYTT